MIRRRIQIPAHVKSLSNVFARNAAVVFLVVFLSFSSCSRKDKGVSWTDRDLLPSARARSAELVLSTMENVGEERALIQPTGSAVKLYEELPARFRIDFHAKGSSGSRASLEIVDEHGKRTNRLAPKKGKASKTISRQTGGIFELTLVAEGPPEGVIVWEELRIHTPDNQASSVSAPQEYDPTNSSPDIFLYVVDALRADHLGCYGYSRDTSPRIDRFAKENAFYLNAYSQTSWTRPSAASILTGLSPKNHRTIGREDRLPDEIITVAERLQAGGYDTIGIVANGHLHPVYGFAQGFQTYKYLGLVSSARVHQEVERILLPRLRRKDRKPLFLLVWTIDPHDPYEPEPEDAGLFSISEFEPLETPEENLLVMINSGKVHPTASQKKYLEARYDQEIRGNDRAFGQLLDFLVSEGLADEAVVFFTSDHGEEFFDHEGVGHGRTLYNEQVRVPLIIKAPMIPPESHMDRIQHIDFYPTILEIAGLGRQEGLEGLSILEGNGEPRTLYFELTLDGYDLTAILDDRKVIYSRTKAGDPSFVPVFEVFEKEDFDEHYPRQLATFRDKLLQQKIFDYRNIMSSHYRRTKSKENSIPPELKEHLKALGYIR